MTHLFALKKEKKPAPVLEESDLDFLALYTASSKEHLQDKFEHFLEHHPNGYIKPKEFRSIMSSCFPNHDYDRLEKRIFNMYDENRDGHISFREFMLVMYVMSNGSPEDNLRQIFRM